MTHLCPTLCASHRDDGYAGSNLFIVRGPAALRLPELWLRVEQQRKRPWRVAAVFGPLLLLGYLLRWFTLDEAMARISARLGVRVAAVKMPMRSEEHTSELQSLMRISYAVFCLKKKTNIKSI